MKPAATPISIAPSEVTNPQAGVITTRPATAPEQKPRMLGLPRVTYSAIAQEKDAVAVAKVVVDNALHAITSPATRLTVVNRYDPTHNKPLRTAHPTKVSAAMTAPPK